MGQAFGNQLFILSYSLYLPEVFMPFTCIPAATAKAMIDQGNVTIVDIRDPNAFAAGHVPNAFSLNNSNVQEFILHADFDNPLLVY